MVQTRSMGALPAHNDAAHTTSLPSPEQGPTFTLNWLFLNDSKRPNVSATDISVSIFKNTRIQYMQDFFLKEIGKVHRLSLKPGSIEFWQMGERLKVKDINKSWRCSVEQLTDHADIVHGLYTLSEVLEETVRDRKFVHLVLTGEVAPNHLSEDSEQHDVLTDLHDLETYITYIGKGARSPSVAAKSLEYANHQGNTAEVIYDGRYPKDGFPTVAPPIHIFHPIFERFIRLLDDDGLQPTRKELSKIKEFVHSSSRISSDANKAAEFRKLLSTILKSSVQLTANDDTTCPDGTIGVTVGSVCVLFVIMEFKREWGEGGCDATIQGGLSAKKRWYEANDESDIRGRCCCPTLILAGGGPWLGVLGAVFTKQFIVQRLTDMTWTGHSSTHQVSHIMRLARILLAFRQCIQELGNYYTNIINNLADYPAINVKQRKTHPRFYPYARSFVDENGKTIKFEYVTSLESDAACVAFQAKTEGSKIPDIVVKFVTTYGADVHKFLAEHGHAPRLRYFGEIPDGRPFETLANCPLPAAHNTVDHRYLPRMFMAVMDYVDTGPTPADARQQIQTVLKELHAEGYVLGDLREPNVLFDKQGKLKLIDFDWSGRYDRSVVVDPVPTEDEVLDLSRLQTNSTASQYAYYPIGLSKKIAWPGGVDDLAPIRPQHDLDMLDKIEFPPPKPQSLRRSERLHH